MEGEEGGPRALPSAACLPPQVWAPREASMGLLQSPLLNNRSSQRRFPCGVFPSFRRFYPLLSYLVLKKRRWVGTGACNVPEIRLEEGSGGRLRGAGGAWVFSPLFRSYRIHGGSSHLLQVPCFLTEEALGLPPLPQGFPSLPFCRLLSLGQK